MELDVQLRILLCTSGPSALEDVRPFLVGAGFAVNQHIVTSTETDELPNAGLVIVDGGMDQAGALSLVRRLRRMNDVGFPSIIVLLNDGSPSVRLAALEAGANGYLFRPFAMAELLIQVHSCLRIPELHKRLVEKTMECQRVNQQLQQAYRQSRQELELARRSQRRFLPGALPGFPKAYFAAHQNSPCQTGANCLDVFRLGEDHLGFYLADVMGQSVQASLLSLFLERGLRAHTIVTTADQFEQPDVMLKRLNQELLTLSLDEFPFISLVYGIFDRRNNSVCLARAGHPPPLLVPQVGDPVFLRAAGSMLGLFETEFTVLEQRLGPGDKLVLYSNNLNSANVDQEPAERRQLLPSAIRQRALPIRTFIRQLAQDLRCQTNPDADFTLFGMEMGG